MSAQSRFVWHDLMTSDVEAAKRFYGELFGWKFKGGDNGYEHIIADREIGGMMKLDATHGAPPHWMGYVSVDDVDAAVNATTKQGGRVYVPKTEIPKVGTFAVVADPQGAVFSPFVYKGTDAGMAETNARPGMYNFCWDELLSTDPDAAAKFYSAVIGWSLESMDMPNFGRYTLLKRTGVKDEMGADKNAGGLMKTPPGVPHPFWLTYIAVPDADAAVAKATKLGATAMSPPMDIPGVGRFATLMDPQHAPFAVLAPNPPA